MSVRVTASSHPYAIIILWSIGHNIGSPPHDVPVWPGLYRFRAYPHSVHRCPEKALRDGQLLSRNLISIYVFRCVYTVTANLDSRCYASQHCATVAAISGRAVTYCHKSYCRMIYTTTVPRLRLSRFTVSCHHNNIICKV